MAKRGLPYQGSKNKLADWIVDILPPADHLYDVFAGGCAVSHAALLSKKWGCVHFSDINDSVVLFKDCLEGNIPDGSEWISREEFYRRKDFDPYVRIVWSFANNQRDYLYSRKLEPYKKAVHEMIYAPTPKERRLKFKEVCRLMQTVTERQSIDHESSERAAVLNSMTGGYLESAQRTERLAEIAGGGFRNSNPIAPSRDLSRLQTEERRAQVGGAHIPFYAGSMRCQSVITEMSKYSRIQSFTAIFPTRTPANTATTHLTMTLSTSGAKNRLHLCLYLNIIVQKTGLCVSRNLSVQAHSPRPTTR